MADHDEEQHNEAVTSRTTQNRLIERDAVLLSHFKLEISDEPEVLVVDGQKVERTRRIGTLVCKGEACGASWDVVLDEGRCPVGPRNSLLSHAQRHAPGYKSPFRRRT